jgi:hypothetical protein
MYRLGNPLLERTIVIGRLCIRAMLREISGPCCGSRGITWAQIGRRKRPTASWDVHTTRNESQGQEIKMGLCYHLHKQCLVRGSKA